jgi:hypothetical protein|tara:strand:+ start:631 stop:3999 length:3369 start_codon:yes stop_codon:yes gene_type:complete
MANKQQPITLSEIIQFHLEKNGISYDGKGTNELEVRFGTRGRSRITKINYDNVIKKLKSLGFTPVNPNGEPQLKIQNQFVDIKTGQTKLSNLRTTIVGLDAIQKYCKENQLTNIMAAQKSYMIKMFAKISDDKIVYPINKDNYNMRISYQSEMNLNEDSNMISSLLDTWTDSKKTFRYINRLTFKKEGLPIQFDLSIEKTSNTDRRNQMIPEYKIQDSGVFENVEKYQIEIELINNAIGTNSEFNSFNLIESQIKYGIKVVLAGLQESNFPISYDEQDDIKMEYVRLFKDKKYDGRINNRDFIGPSSVTLQIKNIQLLNNDSIIPNIRNKYTVTEKADGSRKLLYIANNGKIYFIDTNMNVQYTGCNVKTANNFAGTIIDGEHILHNKNGEFINLYAAFDIYYIKKESVREKSFYPLNEDDIKTNFRLPLLIKIVNELDMKSSQSELPLKIEYKRFYMEGENSTIFDGCKVILDKEKDGLFEYETDGLIFTPAEYGVGGYSKGEASEPKKMTWDSSFKWKPPEYNTIDFLFKTKKGDNDEDDIGNIFQNGMVTTSNSSGILQYKTGELHVGFSTKAHGYINPCNDVLQDNLPKPEDLDDSNEYKPVKFYPTNPYDSTAHLCRIYLETDSAGNKNMKTLEGQVFEDNTIVEFSYDINEKDTLLRWKPLRVRYDKTAEFRSGGRNFGNPYHVANSNWHTIHSPITNEMITTGDFIPDEEVDDDIYYNRVSRSTATRGLRDFHNLVVKKTLITSVASRGDSLIDFAVGKGGDFSKWIASKLSFVFGIDISSDNIENKIDGACARYLNYRKQYKSMPNALFVNGNSGLNIKNGMALFNERDKLTTGAIFGEGPKDIAKLGKGVYRQYGKGSQGFNISSCQFALHYFFENQTTCSGFLTNVAECTQLGGYFIGACYDGNLIFNDLLNKDKGESLLIMEEDKKIWEVTKEYNKNVFDPDVSSLGYAINVYQESINKTFKEYLVNFDYLTRLMENFGFIPLPLDEAKEIGLKNGIGSFSEIFNKLEQDIKRRPYLKNDIGASLEMSIGEKRISFYNKYFIFKKIRIVDAKQVGHSIGDVSLIQGENIKEETTKLSEKVLDKKSDTKKFTKTRKKVTKLKLVPKDNEAIR